MAAPCPVLAFVVSLELRSDLAPGERDALRRAWGEMLDARGLLGDEWSARGGAILVRSEASQATEADRAAVGAWLAEQAKVGRYDVGPLQDFNLSL